jgi:hypothetical protein
MHAVEYTVDVIRLLSKRTAASVIRLLSELTASSILFVGAGNVRKASKLSDTSTRRRKRPAQFA